MMNETIQANVRMEGENHVQRLTVLWSATVFGFTVGALMGLGAGVTLAGYFAR